MSGATRYTGKAIKATEDFNLVRGQGRYVDDVRDDDALFLGIVRSPYAHARITNIDAGEAAKKAKLVILPSDLQGKLADPFLIAVPYGNSRVEKWPVLPSETVHFAGQPVAAVVGRDRYEARDLTELIKVDYEPLAAAVDPVKALDQSSPESHEGSKGNVVLDTVLRSGDVESAFRDADVIVKDSLSCHRVSPNPIETRGFVASWEGDRLNIWASCQSVYRIREGISKNLGIEESRIRVQYVDVGGAFGSKTPVFPEYVLASHATRLLRQPVKWIETRHEYLEASYHGRAVSAEVSLAAKKDGTLLGLRGKVVGDVGAFTFYINTQAAAFVAQQLTGPYRIPASEVRVLVALTNKAPSGPYRGAGRPEAAFFYERMMDKLSAELRMDPVDLRMKNLVRTSEMPYKMPLGLVLDPEDYHQIVNEALRVFDYKKLRAKVDAERRKGRLVGLGVADYIEVNRTSIGESALARLRPDGSLEIVTGLAPHGQDHAMILRQLVADELELPMTKVTVKYGDSDLLSKGIGSFGSRSAVIGGAAALQAAREFKKRLLSEAAKLLGLPENQLVYKKGGIFHKNSELLSLGELAKRVGSLDASVFTTGADIFSFGVHIAQVEVDRESGVVSVKKYFALDDAGKAINPLLAEAQIHGGVIQALGEVFHEEMLYDEEGQLLVGGIGDAGVPTSADCVDIDSVLFEYPSAYPHGARGVGEAGAIGGLPAFVAATEDAIGRRISSTLVRPEMVRALLSGR